MQNSFLRGTRRGLLVTLFALGIVTALTLVASQFHSGAVSKGEGLFTRTTSADPALQNFDIRTGKGDYIQDYFAAARQSVGKDAIAVADVRDGFVRGEDSLRSRIPTVKFEYNTDIRIPEVITPDVWKKSIEWLSGPSTIKRADILRNFIRENNDLVGMTG
jgi:hypothetical protein